MNTRNAYPGMWDRNVKYNYSRSEKITSEPVTLKKLFKSIKIECKVRSAVLDKEVVDTLDQYLTQQLIDLNQPNAFINALWKK